jgi:hypothetical protein
MSAFTDKFEIFIDLGLITIPSNYVHKTFLAGARKRLCAGNTRICEGITDLNYSKQDRVINPGEQFRVCIFRQVVNGLAKDSTTLGQRTSTTEERMNYLSKYKDPVFLGAQGAVLVLEQKGYVLPKGLWCISMDREANCWFEGADPRVSYIFPYVDGNFEVGHFPYGYVWFAHHLFLGFFEVDTE